MPPKIVKLDRPNPSKEVITALETLLKRAKAGEFETILIVAFAPNGSWLTVERGAKLDRLRAVGIMESLKTDLLAATETDEPTGL